MIHPKALLDQLGTHNTNFFVGVPDSLLSSFCAYVDDSLGEDNHLITANEGNAVAVAMGYHMATSKTAAVYMQNSGLGNAVNPLTSLADAAVYSVPMLLVIGWRGEPGVKDEPQHVKQGEITLQQLDLLGIPYSILDSDSEVAAVCSDAYAAMEKSSSPYALVVRKGTFETYKSRTAKQHLSSLSREDALAAILDLTSADDVLISTTGKTSRELFDLRTQRGEAHQDFLTVGGMGHTASIALGVAFGQPNKHVICIDGDGSALMHLGAIPVIGNCKAENLLHIVLNNGAHESVGGQPTVADRTDFEAIAVASNYNAYYTADDAETLATVWPSATSQPGPVMLEIKISVGSRSDLGRPTTAPVENKLSFMAAAQ